MCLTVRRILKKKLKLFKEALSFIEFRRVLLDGVTMREILIGDANSDQHKGWKDPHWESKITREFIFIAVK